MTISYHGSFFKLLLRWKGSIWKACWVEVLVFLIAYYLVSFTYRFAMNKGQKDYFEDLCVQVNAQTKQIPLTFLLGFFVSTIVKRWWDQFERLPWPDDLISLVIATIPGTEHDALLKRRTLARYINLSIALCWRDISTPVFKRFHDVSQLVKAGLMTEAELDLYNQVDVESTRWFLPLQWCQKLIEKDAEVRKTATNVVQNFLKELNTLRKQMRGLYCFDWVCVPMVYTQVVTIATYGYFFLCVFGRQFLNPAKQIREFEADFYIPVMTILQLILYIGWFKVAQHLMNPFGDDDDDLELSYLLDRNIRISFAMVDQLYGQDPPLEKDPMSGRHLNELLQHSRQAALIKRLERPPKSHIRLNVSTFEDTENNADTSPLTTVQEKKSSDDASKKPKKIPPRNRHVREF